MKEIKPVQEKFIKYVYFSLSLHHFSVLPSTGWAFFDIDRILDTLVSKSVHKSGQRGPKVANKRKKVVQIRRKTSYTT